MARLSSSMFQFKQLVSFALSMLSFRHTKRDKSLSDFLNTKAIHFPPVIQPNGESREMDHKEKNMVPRRCTVALNSLKRCYGPLFNVCPYLIVSRSTRTWGWICCIRSLSGVAETWWDASGIFACPDTDSFSARCQTKSGGALPARYTHFCICACPCSACYGFGSLLWGGY